jgi:hypothetical protein
MNVVIAGALFLFARANLRASAAIDMNDMPIPILDRLPR